MVVTGNKYFNNCDSKGYSVETNQITNLNYDQKR